MRQFLIILFLASLVCCAPRSDDQPSPAALKMVPVPPTTPPITSVAAPAGVPQNLFNTALTYYQANLPNIPKPQYLTIVDFTKWSGNVRMWIIDMHTGTVESALHVAHGSGSDPQNTGYAVSFGNVPNSYKSSLGFYLTTDITEAGPHGPELVIDGLSTTDSNARARGILVHSATYVYDQNVQAGRSEGCFAFPQAHRDHVIGELRGGTLLYAGLSGAR
jgi:hypothetical protein